VNDRRSDGGTARPPGAAVRLGRLLGRALVRRCPNCGGRGVFRSYLRQLDVCPHCRLRLDRGEGDFFIGAYTINLIAAEVLVVLGGVAVGIATWPDVPWDALTLGLTILMVVAPVAFYPLSRQVWLALDLLFQPPIAADFAPLPEGLSAAGTSPSLRTDQLSTCD
jgi:uncharacterized protein (DUF983 family)